MLSLRFRKTASKLLDIVNKNKNEYDSRYNSKQQKDHQTSVLQDKMISSNFLFKLIQLVFCQNRENSTEVNGKLQELYSCYCEVINGGELTDRQIIPTRNLNSFSNDDKKKVVKYLHVFDDDFVLENNEDVKLTRLYLDYLFVPMFFDKIKKNTMDSDDSIFFNEIDKLHKGPKFQNYVRYSDYTKDMEQSENIMDIIQFLKDTIKYT